MQKLDADGTPALLQRDGQQRKGKLPQPKGLAYPAPNKVAFEVVF